MTRKNNRKKANHPGTGCGESSRNSTTKILDRLSNEESASLLHILIEQHPEIRFEAEQLAKDLMDSPSIEEVADDVLFRITSVDLEALSERAGSHSWGYVEPSEAARELLEESLEDLVDDIKRRGELGLVTSAETICSGIIWGLYQSRNVNSDGALGWDPDFPAEHAFFVATVLFQSCQALANSSERERIRSPLADNAPEWKEILQRAKQEIRGT